MPDNAPISNKLLSRANLALERDWPFFSYKLFRDWAVGHLVAHRRMRSTKRMLFDMSNERAMELAFKDAYAHVSQKMQGVEIAE